MTTAEAAQKWAEAKDLLESARGALRAAEAAHEAAYAAEREAWEALEALAGRTPITAEIVEPVRPSETHPFSGRPLRTIAAERIG